MSKSYYEKLKDPRWQKKRLEILERAEFACEKCFCENETLHIHHGYYEKGLDPWEYDPKTLWSVCETCHKEAEKERLEVYKQIATIPPSCFDSLKNGVMSFVEHFHNIPTPEEWLKNEGWKDV